MLHLIEQLREFETALIAEAMGVMGCPDPERHYTSNRIALQTTNLGLVAGVAMVMEANTSTPGAVADMENFWEGVREAHTSKAPTILILKAVGARPDHECLCGDGMCKILASVGCAAIVGDGGVRDLEEINKLGFAVFATGTVSNHTNVVYRWAKQPVVLGGVEIVSGDLIAGDRDGVVRVPETYHAGLVEACILSRDFETRVHTFWRRSDKTPAQKRQFVTQLVAEREAKVRDLAGHGGP